MSTLTLDQLTLEMEQWRKTKRSHYSQYPQDLKKKVLSLQAQYSLRKQ
jgi:hypothetical protein